MNNLLTGNVGKHLPNKRNGLTEELDYNNMSKE